LHTRNDGETFKIRKKFLGPKGLMPNPKLGSVSDDVKQAVTDAKSRPSRN